MQTVRTSERAAGERGDNLALFSASGPVAQLYIDKAYYYDGAAAPQSFAVEFP